MATLNIFDEIILENTGWVVASSCKSATHPDHGYRIEVNSCGQLLVVYNLLPIILLDDVEEAIEYVETIVRLKKYTAEMQNVN